MIEEKSEFENKIKELRREYEWKILIEEEFAKIPHSAYLSGYEKHVNFYLPNSKDFNMLVNYFEPTKDTYSMGVDKFQLKSKFRLDLENPIKGDRKMKVTWHHEDICVWVYFATEHIEDFVTETTRGVYDTEKHYYPRMSLKRIRETIRIPSYSWNEESIGWYGGNKTLTNVAEIEAVIQHLLISK